MEDKIKMIDSVMGKLSNVFDELQKMEIRSTENNMSIMRNAYMLIRKAYDELEAMKNDWKNDSAE